MAVRVASAWPLKPPPSTLTSMSTSARELFARDAERLQHLESRLLRFDQLDWLGVDANAALAVAHGGAGDGRLLLA